MSRQQSLAIFIFSAFIAFMILSISILMTGPSDKAMPTLAVLENGVLSPTLQHYIAPEYQTERDTTNQFILQFNDNYETQDEVETLVADMGAEWVEAMPQIQGAVIKFEDTIEPEQLETLSSAMVIEPNYTVQSLSTYPTNDPMLDLQWAWQKIDIPRQWNATDLSSEVIIAVIDSGVCFSHPDLQERILNNGFDFVDDDNDPDDQMGHGCAISGIIAANIDNGIGMAGIAPNAQILPIRVLDAQGIGTYADVMSAIYYAVDNGADIINLSLGGQNPSQLLEQAIDYAIDHGVKVVAGTGNTGSEGVLYPARYEPVIAVGSHDINGNRSSFSTYGAEVDVLAPGEHIVGTKLNGDYSYYSGTSMAAPHISALLALSSQPVESIDFDDLMSTPQPTPTIDLTDDFVQALATNTYVPPTPTIPTFTPTAGVPTYTPAPFQCSDLSIEAALLLFDGITIQVFNSGFHTPLESIEIAYPPIGTYPDLYLEALYFNANPFWRGDGTLTSPVYIDENVLSYDGIDRWNTTNPAALYNELTQFDLIFGSSPDFLSEYWTISDLAGTKLSFHNPSNPQSPCVISIPDDLYQPPPSPTPASHQCSDLSVSAEIFAGGNVLNFYLSNGGGDTDLQSIDWHFANTNDPNAYINIVAFGEGELFWDDLWNGDETSTSPLYMDNDVMSPDGLYYWQFADLRLPHNTTKTLQLNLLNVDVPMSDHWSMADFAGTTFSFYNPADPQSPCTLTIPQDLGELPSPTPVSATAEVTIAPTLIPTNTPTPTATPISCTHYATTYTLGTVQNDLESDLRRAVECANQSSVDNTIDLNGETVTFDYAPSAYDYFGFNALEPIAPVSSGGRLTIQNGLLQRNINISQCELGVVNRALFRFLITKPDSHLNLSNMTIWHGCALDFGSYDDKHGGGIYNQGTLIMDSSQITLNKSINVGGGVYNADYSSFTVTDSVFTHNEGLSGGAIYSDHHNQLTVDNSTLSYNTAYGDCNCGGGGISISYSGELSITGSTITNNFADGSGGGIDNNGSTLTVVDSILGNNTSLNSGGGIYHNAHHTSSITRSKIENNYALAYGGGIYQWTGALNITDSTISHNTAETYHGGGIKMFDTLTITGSTINDNLTGSYGGGIANTNSYHLTLSNSTIYGNSSLYRAGGLALGGSSVTTIYNTTIANNSATDDGGGVMIFTTAQLNIANSIIGDSSSGSDCSQLGGTITFIGMNLIEDGSCDATTNGQLTGDPKLDPGGLQLTTGSMPTVPLLSDSPAIDVGDDTQINGLTYDQRGVGFPRIYGIQVDLGAYEYQPNGAINTPSPMPSATLTPNPTSTFTPTPTLTYTPSPTPTFTPSPTPTFTPLIPLSMSSISATFIDEASSQITWSDDNINEDGYRILRRVSDTWSEIGVVAADLTTYLDATIDCQADLTYDYQIQAYRNVDGDTANSNIASLWTGDCPFITPDGLNPNTITDTQVMLSWNDNSILESGYNLYRKTASQPWAQIATLPANSTAFSDNNLECERQYQYQLQGYQALFDRHTAPINISVTTGKCEVVVPDNVSTTITSSQTAISWNPIPAQQTTQIIVERAAQETEAIVGLSLDWQVKATLGGGATVFTDHDLRCGMTYSYRLRGYNERHDEYTNYSDMIQITTNECPVPVTNTIGLYHNGRWAFREGFDNSSPDNIFRFGPQEAGWTPLTGDWDGDGVDGIGIYKEGVFALRDISDEGAVDYVYRFGNPQVEWQPIVGDWNGDGIDTVGLYREGRFILSDSHTQPTTDYQFIFGKVESGWQPIAGDWFGFGRDYVGIYKAGVFLLHDSFQNSSSGTVVRFGSGDGWIPVAGDWDADGDSTIGLYKDNNWRLSNTHNRTVDIGMRFDYFNGQGYPLASYRGGGEALEALALFSVDHDININSAPQVDELTHTPHPEITLTTTNTAISATEVEVSPTLEMFSGTEEVTITTTATIDVTVPLEPTALPTLLIPTPTMEVAVTPEPSGAPTSSTILPTATVTYTPTIEPTISESEQETTIESTDEVSSE